MSQEHWDALKERLTTLGERYLALKVRIRELESEVAKHTAPSGTRAPEQTTLQDPANAGGLMKKIDDARDRLE
jgi:hypothetical protein